VLDSEFPNLVQMDVSALAGILAERLLARVPHLEKVFFANSGTECVEAAIKFVRAATGRAGIAYCGHAFHGLTYGSLSLNGDTIFKKGFEGFLTDCVEVPFNDLTALEDALKSKKIAGFFIEPIQGKGVNIPDDGYLKGVQELCRKYGTVIVADEIQTGMGRTGKFLAVEHWGVEPDVVLLAKSLSGGHIPVGAVLTRKWIFDKLFNRMDRAVVHGSTFAKNDMAMAAGLATLDVLEEEQVIENAARQGERLMQAFRAMMPRYELMKDVRGKGVMIGVEFGAPKSIALKMSWHALEAANAGLFCQMITIPLFKDHKILAQVAGHASHTIKLLPPLTITDEDCKWIEGAFEETIAAAHKVPGAVWSLGKTLAGHAMSNRAEA
jgi:ornithine--oxo-acid transaminase